MPSPAPAPAFRRTALVVLALTLGGCALPDALFQSAERSGKLLNGKQTGPWTYRYPSGSKKAEGSYVADRQVGHWTYWYENGNVEWEGEFDDYRLSGPTYLGYENGERRAVGLFANGFEDGLWSFYDREGRLEEEGDYTAGTPALRWSYFHPDGTLLGQGFRLDGERVGLWQFYGETGELSERRFPIPDGVDVVFETWDGTTPRREGILVNGEPSGRWATYHPNGRRRLTVDFSGGRLDGVFVAWKDTGEPLAMGTMSNGAPSGQWRRWRRAVAGDVPLPRLDAAAGPVSWSSAGAPQGDDVEATLAQWTAEVLSPHGEPVDQSANPNTPAPPSAFVARTEVLPEIPMRPQPWTVLESEALEYLVARYSDGARDVAPPRRGGAYGSRRGSRDRRGAEPEGGDPELSARFLGTSLPWTRFYEADGTVVDLDDYRGRNKVVLVVLRGFAREVCVYCVTQTEALCENVDAFKDLGCEVFVVYPGERNRLEAFLESFKTVSKRMGEPPIGVLYDPNMQLVERMGITAELAIPSTFVIDEGGTIRYSYVGQAIDDRPPAEDVLDAIRALPTP